MDRPITCEGCGTVYATEEHFRAVHHGPHVKDLLRALRQHHVALVNCPNCPLPLIAKARPQ